MWVRRREHGLGAARTVSPELDIPPARPTSSKFDQLRVRNDRTGAGSVQRGVEGEATRVFEPGGGSGGACGLAKTELEQRPA